MPTPPPRFDNPNHKPRLGAVIDRSAGYVETPIRCSCGQWKGKGYTKRDQEKSRAQALAQHAWHVRRADPTPEEKAEDRREFLTALPILLGTLLVVGGFVVFVVWAVFFEVESPSADQSDPYNPSGGRPSCAERYEAITSGLFSAEEVDSMRQAIDEDCN